MSISWFEDPKWHARAEGILAERPSECLRALRRRRQRRGRRVNDGRRSETTSSARPTGLVRTRLTSNHTAFMVTFTQPYPRKHFCSNPSAQPLHKKRSQIFWLRTRSTNVQNDVCNVFYLRCPCSQYRYLFASNNIILDLEIIHVCCTSNG